MRSSLGMFYVRHLDQSRSPGVVVVSDPAVIPKTTVDAKIH
jgi:hypothetical protein